MSGWAPHSMLKGSLPAQDAPRQRGGGTTVVPGEAVARTGSSRVPSSVSSTLAVTADASTASTAATTTATRNVRFRFVPSGGGGADASRSGSARDGASAGAWAARPLPAASAISHRARQRPSGSPASRHSARTASRGGRVSPFR